MGTYQDRVDYFRGLATANLKVAHSATQKKFYTMDIEELYTALRNDLPAPDRGPFVVFINYIREVKQKHVQINDLQMGLVFMQGYAPQDWQQEETARNNSEIVLDEFLNKMKSDSENGHPLFNYSFDTIKARITPYSGASNIGFVGWMVTFPSLSGYNCTHNSANWL